MERTLIKFGCFWRKISRKDGCKGVSESALQHFTQYISIFRKLPLYIFRDHTNKNCYRLLFTPWPGAHSNGIQPIEKSPAGEGLDARPITELAGCRAASARHRVNSNCYRPRLAQTRPPFCFPFCFPSASYQAQLHILQSFFSRPAMITWPFASSSSMISSPSSGA